MPTIADQVASPSSCVQCGKPFCGSSCVRSIVCTYCGHVTIDESVKCERIEPQVIQMATARSAIIADPLRPFSIMEIR